MKEVKLFLFNAGYCMAKASHAVKGDVSSDIQFGALYGIIEHPVIGWILFDTGYANRFFDASRYYPNKFYALTTKVTIYEDDEVRNKIKMFGLECADIKHIFISHFHADHVCGLKDFTNATIYCSKQAYNHAMNINGWLAFSKGILKDLLPLDLKNRVQFVEDMSKCQDDIFFGSRYDLFQDNSLIAYPLPGHAVGQMGILLKTNQKKYFLVADACWDLRAYKSLQLPSQIVRLFFDSWHDYKSTLIKLKQFHEENPDVEIVPTHCSKTTQKLMHPNRNLNEL